MNAVELWFFLMSETYAVAAFVGLIVTLLINLGGLIWGAAKISTAVVHLDGVTQTLESAVSKLRDAVAVLDKRITVLEDRVERE